MINIKKKYSTDPKYHIGGFKHGFRMVLIARTDRKYKNRPLSFFNFSSWSNINRDRGKMSYSVKENKNKSITFLYGVILQMSPIIHTDRSVNNNFQ